MKNLGKYSKFIVSLAGTLAIGLQTQFPNSTWTPIVTAVATALLTYAVPNSGGPS